MLAVPTSAGDNDAWHHYSRDALTDGTETLCISPQKEDDRTNFAVEAWSETNATMLRLDLLVKNKNKKVLLGILDFYSTPDAVCC